MSQRKPGHIAILGGGLAGLFTAYHLKEAGVPATVYEESDRIGGNCVTFRSGGFYYDSGAHRFHDKDKAATDTIKTLLGDRLKRTESPSRIYSGGRLVDFPLSAISLVRSLGILGFARSTYQIARSRLKDGNGSAPDLEGYATRTYGNDIAERFLLNYSEKLWGVPAERLSSGVAKVRLKGLSIQGFLRDAVRGARSGGAHLDGSFYYPECGIGMIADALGEVIGPGRIRKCSRVSKVEHDGCRIRSIIVNGRKRVEVDRVVSTIPLTHLVRIMDPAPGEDVMAQARALSYRSLILVALFLRKTSVSPEATVYFPEKEFIFTRAYEPKNRGSYMAPPDETSLVLEIPCDSGDRYWEKADERMVELVLSQIEDTGLIAHKEILGTEIRRIEYAYPVVDLESESRTTALLQFLDGFSNLAVAGRNGRFVYCSIHDLIIESRKIVGAYRACDAEFSGTAGLKAD